MEESLMGSGGHCNGGAQSREWLDCHGRFGTPLSLASEPRMRARPRRATQDYASGYAPPPHPSRRTTPDKILNVRRREFLMSDFHLLNSLIGRLIAGIVVGVVFG